MVKVNDLKIEPYTEKCLMRKWYRFRLEENGSGIVYESPYRSFSQQKQRMGGYTKNEFYKNKDTFWKKYFQGKYVDWEDFFKKHLSLNDEILSIGSGRCINETRLLDTNHHVTCSDLQIIPAFEETKKIFGNFEFVALDILKTSPLKEYDKIICLSLIYLFNEEELDIFFNHVNRGLKVGGQLLLDSAGPEDNLVSYVLHNIYLKFESYFRYFVGGILGKKYQLVKQEAGYRRTNQEIIALANKNDLQLVSQQNYDFLTDFRRSHYLNILINRSILIKKILTMIGRHAPYIRMFKFQKLK